MGSEANVPDAAMGGRPCPTRCGQQVAIGDLMCAGCWRWVPAPMRKDIMRTWHIYERNGADAAWDEYRRAYDNAVAVARQAAAS